MGGAWTSGPEGGWEEFEKRLQERVREIEATHVDVRPELPVWLDEPGEWAEYRRKRLADKKDEANGDKGIPD